ncbi:MAG: hypothetical protein HN341_13565 [Verrucomicrobia bacterium]|nr:hypothetical protein [Verrucomicrobiota bacterium]
MRTLEKKTVPVNRLKKGYMMRTIVAIVTASTLIAASLQAALVIDTTAPTGVVISNTVHLTSFGADGGSTITVGQTFITDGESTISQITVLKGSAQTYKADNFLRLQIFEWTPSSDSNDSTTWTTGNGGAEPVDSAGMTSLLDQNFSLASGTIAAESFLHFQLDSDIDLEANTAYGFTIEFVYGGLGAPDNMNFRLHNSSTDTYTGGGKLYTTATSSSLTSNQDMAFYIGGTAAESTLLEVVVDSSAPTGVVISNTTHFANFSADDSDTYTVGQTFLTDGAISISEIAVLKGTEQSYSAGNFLRLQIFKWTPSNDPNIGATWQAGNGGADPVANAGMTSLLDQNFSFASGTIAAEAFMHFELESAIELEEHTAYGFTIEFVHGGSGGDSMTFRMDNSATDSYAGGGKLYTTSASSSLTTTHDMPFYVVGTSIGSSSPQLVIDATPPTGTIISNVTFNSQVGSSASSTSTVGQTFYRALTVTEIAVVKGGAQTFSNPGGAYLRLQIFEWDPSNDPNVTTTWATGSGGTNPVASAGMTSLLDQNFWCPPSTMLDESIIHFELDSAVTLSENTAYGFTIEFVFRGAGGTSMTFKQSTGGDFAQGTKLSTTATANNSGGGTHDLAFYLVGTPHPPIPSIFLFR